MKKINNFFNFKQLFYYFLQAFLLLQILIYTTEFFYPANFCKQTSYCFFADSAKFIAGMQNIFFAYALIFLIVAMYFAKIKNSAIKYFFIFLSIFSYLFAFFSTKGHVWYFYGGVNYPESHLKFSLKMIFLWVLLSIFLKRTKNEKKIAGSIAYEFALFLFLLIIGYSILSY